MFEQIKALATTMMKNDRDISGEDKFWNVYDMLDAAKEHNMITSAEHDALVQMMFGMVR